MKLNNYSPTFRNVLLQEVVETQTKGGIYIPSTVFIEDKVFKVIKAGKDCIAVQEGDLVKLMRGIRLDDIKLDEGKYNQVMEQQIIGYERDDSIRTTLTG